MAASRLSTRQPSFFLLCSFSTATRFSHHNNHQNTHKFLEPSSFVGSWETPKDPKEAEAKLALLRREYAKQVKQVRKEYIREVELMRLEKKRKDDAKREAMRIANEEKKKLKAEAAKIRAEERKVAEQEFRNTLLKERAEKLEHWRKMAKSHEDKKKENRELLRRKSSLWINEAELEKVIVEAFVDAKQL